MTREPKKCEVCEEADALYRLTLTDSEGVVLDTEELCGPCMRSEIEGTSLYPGGPGATEGEKR